MFKVFKLKNVSVLSTLLAVYLISASCGGGGGGGARITPPPEGGTPPQNGGSTLDVAQSPGEVGGVIKDASGRPVPELEVYLDASQNFVASTDAQGEFLISGVSSGQHLLYIGKEGEQVSTFSFTYDASGPLNLSLQRLVKSVSQLGGTLTGNVTDGSGSPIAEVKVLIFDRAGFFLVGFTDASGVYTIDEVPAGDYFLLGFRRGYRTHVGQVTISESQTTTYDFVMGGQPTGSLNGNVTDTAGVPLSRTHVFLIYNERDPRLPAPPSFQVLTDDQGNYSFEVVPAGIAFLLVFKPEFVPQDRQVNVPPNSVVTEDFVLSQSGAGEATEPGSSGTIVGQVLREEDDGSLHGTGARVFLFLGEPLEGNSPIRQGESNEAGEFRFTNLSPSGEQMYFIVAQKIRHEHLWRGVTTTSLGEGELAEVTVIIRPTEVVNPPSGTASLAGTVFGGDQPMAGARVELKRLEQSFETTTAEDGAYSFTDVPAGFYEYEVEADGFAEIEGEIFLEEGENQRDFFLHEGITPPPGSGGVITGFIFKLEDHRNVSSDDDTGDDDGDDLNDDNGDDNGGDDLNDDNSGDGNDDDLDGGDDNGGDDLNDDNGGDGNDDLSGDDVDEMEPEDAIVTLFHGDPNNGGELIATVESGEDGSYAFDDVPASGETPYFIVAEKDEDSIHFRGVAQTLLEEGVLVNVNVVMTPVA